MTRSEHTRAQMIADLRAAQSDDGALSLATFERWSATRPEAADVFEIRRHFGTWLHALDVAGIPSAGGRPAAPAEWDQVVESIRRCRDHIASTTREPVTRMSLASYSAARLAIDDDAVVNPYYFERMGPGTYREACAAAGLEAGLPRPLVTRTADHQLPDDVLAPLAERVRELGEMPSTRRWDQYVREHRPAGGYCADTIARAAQSWQNAEEQVYAFLRRSDALAVA